MVSAALINEVSLGRKNAVLSEPLIEKHAVDCLTF